MAEARMGVDRLGYWLGLICDGWSTAMIGGGRRWQLARTRSGNGICRTKLSNNAPFVIVTNVCFLTSVVVSTTDGAFDDESDVIIVVAATSPTSNLTEDILYISTCLRLSLSYSSTNVQIDFGQPFRSVLPMPLFEFQPINHLYLTTKAISSRPLKFGLIFDL
ncbi:uncharacterized protein E5676_scaffold343G001100 [Cucumis melo var. makuwa]|uniref:Uncharacterized protein n=1 Tax=Cucumis melo var. makuwa TaxID=1194695 RepID=A0A5A7SM19_CUCMM|nr:uncharacterized protein E6C27_scaffold19G001580 [Cucumis melo var. makuwa]TYK30766.1 uncharacterized protein E5676_scaffold343G001100 [Cucumis melo var. makuwa]